MNPDLQRLQPYPFEKLARLKQGVTPPGDLEHVALSIGEPRHPTPGFISEELITHVHGLSNYPVTRGGPALRESIRDWLQRRFRLPADSVDANANVLPVSGTREALFALAQCVIDRGSEPLVMMPNPFYQIYEGAALLAGAHPWFLSASPDRGFVPDFDTVPEDTWRRCQLIYICSPGNPTGAVLDVATLQKLIDLAQRHDFVIASDECYSEIYFDEDRPPPGLLGAAAAMGNTDYRRCVVFHSLSKRSNAPGLRSGFVAGDAGVLEKFLLYRTYQGCAMPPPTQAASVVAWRDERHVADNRALYREKFDAVLEILQPVLNVQRPDAGFYLWPETPIDDTEFARGLFAAQNVTVLPGSYLSRSIDGGNPGHRRLRIALVARVDACIEAAQRIRAYVESL
jgi:N-succinyldiaminopimelate aminotransferase